MQPDLIPDRRHLNAQVGVVGQQRQARRGMLPADDPVVAAQQRAAAQRTRRAADELGRDARPIDSRSRNSTNTAPGRRRQL